MNTLQKQITSGARCSLCGQSFNSQNTAKIIRLSRERTKGVDVYAFICSRSSDERHKHDGEPKSLLYTYYKIEGEQGFRTVVLQTMQVLESKDPNSFKLLLDVGELQLIYDNLVSSDIRKQIGAILDTVSLSVVNLWKYNKKAQEETRRYLSY